jgi:hypothetical protein
MPRSRNPIAVAMALLAVRSVVAAEGEGEDQQAEKERHNIRVGYDAYGDKFHLDLSTPLGSGGSDQHWNHDNAVFVGYYARPGS